MAYGRRAEHLARYRGLTGNATPIALVHAKPLARSRDRITLPPNILLVKPERFRFRTIVDLNLIKDQQDVRYSLRRLCAPAGRRAGIRVYPFTLHRCEHHGQTTRGPMASALSA